MDLVGDPQAAPRDVPVALDEWSQSLLPKDAVLVDKKRRGERPHAIMLRHLAILVQQDRQPKSKLPPKRIDRRSVFLQITVNSMNRSPCMPSARRWSSGISVRHGMHHVAQKLTSTTFPRCWARSPVPPSRSGSLMSGAGEPGRAIADVEAA